MKTFKFILKARSSGKLLASQEVDFKKFPKDWKENGSSQIALFEHKEKFINEMVEVEIIEL